MADKWIQHAIKHKGAATAKAKAEGLSVEQWAEKHQHDKDISGKQARLALTLHHISSDEDKEQGGSKEQGNGGMGRFH